MRVAPHGTISGGVYMPCSSQEIGGGTVYDTVEDLVAPRKIRHDLHVAVHGACSSPCKSQKNQNDCSQLIK